ncbi:WD repeat-containing protein jip5 [Golovinomyces cichoracearum]|uniref:WD repeat-containing protein JIP5 n=1 Tax=Golovinomyces cichoracearum TaxID=62708 RepID=A0A420IFZ9_9PEZI|nr:WD repeat-containing protein jip5 [Golovinomyces cichoracearum]
MFENLCTFPLSSHLFAQALHPSQTVLAVGLASGHVESLRLPSATGGDPSDDDENNDDDEMDMNTSVISSGTSTIETEWRTRRHHGSCRTLAYSTDGEALFSSGTDSLVKAASSQTGQVFAKIAVPQSPNLREDAPCLLHALSPQTLILATDSAALHVYDLRQPNSISSKPAQTYLPHDDYITSLIPLPPNASSTSGFSKQWVSTGGTTLAVTDLRKGIISQSEDQEEELMCSVFVGGLSVKPGRSTGEKVIVGDGSGVLTLWERGIWDDQQERIRIATRNNNSCSIESIAVVPDDVGDGKHIVAGIEDGKIAIVKIGPNKIVSTLQHDELEGVMALGFDVEDRLISGGGLNVKVWQENYSSDITEDEEDDDDDDDDDDSTSSSDGEETKLQDKDISHSRKSRTKIITIADGTMNAHGILKLQGLD